MRDSTITIVGQLDTYLYTTRTISTYLTAFDALAKGGGDLVAPRDLNEAVTRWRVEGDGGPLDQFSSDLLQATVKKYSAYSVFFLLLALVFDLIVESGVNAFL